MKKPFAKRVGDLEVFRRAYAVSLQIHKTSLQFPKIEQYALADQLRRASKSICANLTEGFARQSQSKVEFKRFITIALGSAQEAQLWIVYAFDLGYIAEVDFNRWTADYEGIIGMLVNLRGKL